VCFDFRCNFETFFILRRIERDMIKNFNCCPSVHVDSHTIITPTKCTLLLLKTPDIKICTFLSYILPLRFNPRGSSSGGSMPVLGWS
jgi:hypothetical protein